MRARALGLAVALLPLLLRGASAAELSAADAAAGRRLYLNKCGRCHRFYNPAAYEAARWERLMRKMRGRAHLTDEQYQVLSAYLDTVRVAKKPQPASSAVARAK